jgi:hypothetical protein
MKVNAGLSSTSKYKGYKENIPAIKDCNGRPIIDLIEQANYFNYYYSLVLAVKVTSNITVRQLR